MKRLIVLMGGVGISLSAIFVRWADAPSTVLAMYRMLFSALLVAPALLLGHRKELAALSRKELGLCLASGCALGLHFSAYFESLRWTSVAAAVALVDTEVLFVALATVTLFRGELSRRAWLAIGLAFIGSIAVAMADTAAGGADALRGDLLALAGSVCVAVYTMIGSVCRRTVSTTVYTFVVYLTAAVTVLAVNLAAGIPVAGYGAADYGAALGMAVFCTLLGHSLFSWGLKYLPAAFISVVKLMEPVFAALWALLLFREVPGIAVVLGGGLIVAGLVLYSLTAEEKRPAEEV